MRRIGCARFSPLLSFFMWRAGRLAPQDHLASLLARAVPHDVRDHCGLTFMTFCLIILLGPRVLGEDIVAFIHVLVDFHVTV